ncbi:flagellin [Thalassobaculum sp. OXR-137]|uniref:flagellin N-terminal helical domain-containing protein n=1 Tax=Thalassobaculum sp. OXR-137 TaxID=3100173 RepID=UPI002AC9D3A5|nr:flagellin [Thalassobaculum sp. OXR-137]WPZ34175.1 flagellin [Thalassobaculum sp. OXR-137]
MASNSILTNPEALVALRNLERTNNLLATTQNRVSTGLKVTGAIDDASNFAIAQGIRGDIKALGAISQGLNNSKGIANVAIAGATSISDLLQTVRQKLTELSNEGITTTQRQILTNDFTELLSQAANFIDNAVFNGVNLLDTAGAAPSINTLSNLAGGTLTLTNANLRTQVLSLAAVGLGTANAAQGVIANQYSNLESVVNAALGSLGAEARALDLQTSFLDQITDATEEGLGNIVDADMARESARLTALQVRQQLGVQVLGIANQSPQILLGLFQ